MHTVLGNEVAGQNGLYHFVNPELPQKEFILNDIATLPADHVVKPKPLPSEYKAEWLFRLRDPKSKQAKEKLCIINVFNQEAYCCLGLYAELRGIHKHSVLSSLEYDFPDPNAFEEMAHSSTALKGNIADEVEGQGMLAILNDGGWNFLEIADLIEATY